MQKQTKNILKCQESVPKPDLLFPPTLTVTKIILWYQTDHALMLTGMWFPEAPQWDTPSCILLWKYQDFWMSWLLQSLVFHIQWCRVQHPWAYRRCIVSGTCWKSKQSHTRPYWRFLPQHPRGERQSGSEGRPLCGYRQATGECTYWICYTVKDLYWGGVSICNRPVNKLVLTDGKKLWF